MNRHIRKQAVEVKRLREQYQKHHDELKQGQYNPRLLHEKDEHKLKYAEEQLCNLVLQALENEEWDALVVLRAIALNLPDTEPKYENPELWYSMTHSAWIAGEMARAFLRKFDITGGN